jgi:hypothetical protein
VVIKWFHFDGETAQPDLSSIAGLLWTYRWGMLSAPSLATSLVPISSQTSRSNISWMTLRSSLNALHNLNSCSLIQ